MSGSKDSKVDQAQGTASMDAKGSEVKGARVPESEVPDQKSFILLFNHKATNGQAILRHYKQEFQDAFISSWSAENSPSYPVIAYHGYPLRLFQYEGQLFAFVKRVHVPSIFAYIIREAAVSRGTESDVESVPEIAAGIRDAMKNIGFFKFGHKSIQDTIYGVLSWRTAASLEQEALSPYSTKYEESYTGLLCTVRDQSRMIACCGAIEKMMMTCAKCSNYAPNICRGRWCGAPFCSASCQAPSCFHNVKCPFYRYPELAAQDQMILETSKEVPFTINEI